MACSGQGLMLLMRWFGSACGACDAGWLLEVKVKRAGADAADALVWICLWWPEGEAGRG